MNVAYGMETTTDELLAQGDLSGRRVLITGTSSGLGVETARALVAHNAHVVGAARDLTKARSATEAVNKEAVAGAGAFELIELDLASLASVRRCAQRLVDQGEPFDLIVANAGVMACPWGVTDDGFETHFGTNHLGHFVLVNRLMPLLRPGARVVILSSMAHVSDDVDLDDPGFAKQPYDPWAAYSRSKTANALFAVELDRRYRDRGIRVTAVHPGAIETELGRHMSAQDKERRIAQLHAELAKAGSPTLHFKTVPQGAATSVWAGIVAPADLVGGRYCEDCHVAEINPVPKSRAGVQPYAVDPVRAEALWALSERLVGEQF